MQTSASGISLDIVVTGQRVRSTIWPRRVLALTTDGRPVCAQRLRKGIQASEERRDGYAKTERSTSDVPSSYGQRALAELDWESTSLGIASPEFPCRGGGVLWP